MGPGASPVQAEQSSAVADSQHNYRDATVASAVRIIGPN
jgi:hypothetical protein